MTLPRAVERCRHSPPACVLYDLLLQNLASEAGLAPALLDSKSSVLLLDDPEIELALSILDKWGDPPVTLRVLGVSQTPVLLLHYSRHHIEIWLSEQVPPLRFRINSPAYYYYTIRESETD